MATPRSDAPRSALELDRLVHEPLRLGLLTALASGKQRSFAELKSVLRVTDGNLSVHARRLEEAGYIACEKRFQGRIPQTVYRLTAAGRRALDHYLSGMAEILRAARRR